MKTAFLHDMELMYPDGVPSREQLRDLVRTYAMGWVAALAQAGDEPRVADWFLQFRGMEKEDWWPDDSWMWWIPF